MYIFVYLTSYVEKLCAKVVRYMALHMITKTRVDNSTRVLTLKVYFRYCKYNTYSYMGRFDYILLECFLGKYIYLLIQICLNAKIQCSL